MKDIFVKKPINKILADADDSEGKGLKRVLGAWDLTAIGIGCIIGTGIFVLTGVAAVKYAGPGIMISFVISGMACAFAALCYAEFASLVPIAGSAYTYGYATLGELFAWIIGWDLILEYAVAGGAVAIGWSGYFCNLYEVINKSVFKGDLPVLPESMTTIHCVSHPGGCINLPAALIVLAITALLVVGIKESATVNSIIVTIKVVIALLFVGIGAFFVKASNWHPLIPPFVEQPERIADPLETPLIKGIFTFFGHVYPEGFGGWPGVFTAAAIIFFAYIGFDAVSTTAEEAKNPKRDLPIGILASLLICTVLYIAMSAVFTGIVKCDGTLKVADMGAYEGAPMAYAFTLAGKQSGLTWVSTFASGAISIGAICGITSVLLVTLLGQSRIFFSMSRDRLMPAFVAAIHPKFKTPYITTIVTGIVVAIAAAITPIEIIAELANIGTLFAFVIVCAGILFLRKMDCGEGRECFKTPGAPWVPILGVLLSLFLMLSLPIRTWYRFVAWLILGLTFYFCYSYFNSTLREKLPRVQQLLTFSITGIIYILGYPILKEVYATLLGVNPASFFVHGLGLILLIIGVWKGTDFLKSGQYDKEEISPGDRKKGTIAVGISVAGIVLMVVLMLFVPYYRIF